VEIIATKTHEVSFTNYFVSSQEAQITQSQLLIDDQIVTERGIPLLFGKPDNGYCDTLLTNEEKVVKYC
jgi:hypothetical protein